MKNRISGESIQLSLICTSPTQAVCVTGFQYPNRMDMNRLHTTVVGPRGKWVEVQIRSSRMDEIAEKGLAAHFKYKGIKGEGGLDTWLTRMREILESSEKEDDAFLDQVRSGLYTDEVFVFTPKGDLRQLPAGATVLDFAFDIHTACRLFMRWRNGKREKCNNQICPSERRSCFYNTIQKVNGQSRTGSLL